MYQSALAQISGLGYLGMRKFISLQAIRADQAGALLVIGQAGAYQARDLS